MVEEKINEYLLNLWGGRGLPMYKRSERNHNRKDIAQYFEMLYFYMYTKGQTKLKVITKENKKCVLKTGEYPLYIRNSLKGTFTNQQGKSVRPWHTDRQ